jgi:flagellar protein FlaI
MLNLMINALRMRPDRIIVGEVRKHEHAEVLFEAIHTGHPIIGTFHADTASGGLRRLIEPPMDIPPIELEALHLFITQFRNRRTGVRRTTQIAEILPSSEELKVALNLTFRWEPRTDGFMPVNESVKIFEEVSATSGMNTRELMNDLQEKKRILDWLCKNKYSDVNGLGLVMANYYVNKDIVLKAMTSNLHPSTVGQ